MKMLTLISAMMIYFGVALDDAVKVDKDQTTAGQIRNEADRITKDGYLLDEITVVAKGAVRIK